MISNKRRSSSHSSGQALAEFAIIIIFLSMLMFFIVDMARVGWAWVTVQGAARAGARYASTGNASCQDPPSRLDCVVDAAFNYMDTLKLHEDPEASWGSDNAYRIEVWGIDESNDGPWYDYPGAAGKSVVVRTYYWVPIITPFLKPIKASIPVYGQVTITNELFDSLGGASAGVGLPPPAPPIPPAQPTATFTPSPTHTPTVTPTNTVQPTNTPPAPICDTRFEGYLVAGDSTVNVTGNLDSPPSTVEIWDWISPPGAPILLGTATLADVPGHACEGFATVPVSPTLIAGRLISVVNTYDGSWDTEPVLADPPTPTPEPPTPLPTPLPTATPTRAYIILDPTCGFSGDVSFAVEGHNWNVQASPVNLFWVENGGLALLNDIILAGHPPDFVRIWNFTDVPPGTHEVVASSGSTIERADFEVPCDNPADLLISDPIISSPPSTEYEAFEVQVVITNSGEIDAGQQFFVDVFLDPSEIYTNSIPLYQSDGYLAVSGLSGGSSRTVTIDVPFGFTDGMDENREVWAMVDSFEQINETDEENNIGGPALVTGILTSTVGTPTPTPAGAGEISGIVRISLEGGGRIQPQARAQLWLVDESLEVISTAFSDINGHYQFLNIEIERYRVWACVPIDGLIFADNLLGIVPTNTVADLLLLEDLGCPY